MRSLLLLATAAAAPADQPRTYLVSIVDIAIKPGERIESFSISTWGVTVRAVCRVPHGWRITAGNSAAPDGLIEGEGSHGATWFSQPSPRQLQGFVLLTLNGPVRRRDIGSLASGGLVPATFKGQAMIQPVDADGERKVALTHANVALTPATRCPAPPR